MQILHIYSHSYIIVTPEVMDNSAEATDKGFAEFCTGEKDPLVELVKHESCLRVLSRYSRYENTYQLGPQEIFPYYKVAAIMHDVMNSTLHEVEYNPKVSSQLSIEISEKIKVSARKLKCSPRYKIAVIVHLGQRNNQGLYIGSRCLWNSDQDTFASVQYTNSTLFAVAILYACYYE